MDVWRYLGCRFPIGRTRSHDDSPLHVTWRNLGASSSIERTQLNSNDSYPSVSSEPLMEDEESNPTITPNFVYKLRCSSTM